MRLVFALLPQMNTPMSLRIVKSSEPEIMDSPLDVNATDLSTPVCPCSVASDAPDTASHRRSELSFEHVPMRRPSIDHATDRTGPVWPFKTRVG